MGEKKFNIKGESKITPCPTRGNNKEFVAKSQQVSEDCCDIWVQCKCGFDPTAEKSLHRVEDVWGTLDTENILTALGVWDELILESKLEKEKK